MIIVELLLKINILPQINKFANNYLANESFKLCIGREK